MILGQLRMRARQTKNAPLGRTESKTTPSQRSDIVVFFPKYWWLWWKTLMKPLETPAAAEMILLSCHRIVEQGCGAQLLSPGRFALKSKKFIAENDVTMFDDLYMLIDWHLNKMLPIHIESLSCVLRLNWIRIHHQDADMVVSPGICLVIEPLPYWNRRTSRLLLFGSSVGFCKVLDKHGRIVLHFLFVSFVLSLWIEQWAMFMKMTWINRTQNLKTWTADIFETTCSLIMHAKVGPNKAPGSAFSKRPPTKRSTSDTFLMKVMISMQPQ